jgi:DNA-directed RNA polymerase II subunit RPB9
MSGQAISFCRSCSNMLVPRESKADKKLLLACRGCGLSQECASAVVFKHELVKSAANELEQIPDDIITDPTLQREPVECPKCAKVGAVFFMAKVNANDNRLKLIYVCTNIACIHRWSD